MHAPAGECRSCRVRRETFAQTFPWRRIDYELVAQWRGMCDKHYNWERFGENTAMSHLPRGLRFRRDTWAIVALLAIGPLNGCAPVRGFPDDPDTRREAIDAYYGPSSEKEYDEAKDDGARIVARDKLIRKRMYGYDQSYSDFKRRLTTDGNVVSTGGSLAALVLGGLAATTGHAATASALGAAGAGVVGAQSVINKDLYFQKTLPALISEMDAARDKVIVVILAGIAQSDARYPLVRANVDLQKLKDAGSIEAAINTVNQTAADKKAEAQKNLFERAPSYIDTCVARQAILTRLKTASRPAVVKIANAMLLRFDTAEPVVQTVAKRYIPPSGGFAANQSSRARQFVTHWAEYETMTPDRQKAWSDAISAAAAR